VYDWRLNLTDNCLWKQIMRRTSSLGGILTSCPCSFELLSTFGFAILLLAIMIQINIESCNNWIQYFKLEESHWACQFVESDILTQGSGIYALQQNESNEEFRTWIRSFVESSARIGYEVNWFTIVFELCVESSARIGLELKHKLHQKVNCWNYKLS
jgi:hypothetical protein